MEQGICKNCINMLNADYKIHGVIACIYSSRIETDEVLKCSHFKPKEVKDNTIEQAKKSLKGKGQTYS